MATPNVEERRKEQEEARDFERPRAAWARDLLGEDLEQRREAEVEDEKIHGLALPVERVARLAGDVHTVDFDPNLARLRVAHAGCRLSGIVERDGRGALRY